MNVIGSSIDTKEMKTVSQLNTNKSEMKPLVIITADDFGISMERTLGIIKAMKDGICTATSIMAGAPYAMEAISIARSEGLLHRVGLHLNLSEGVPLSSPEEIPSLLAPVNCTDIVTGMVNTTQSTCSTSSNIKRTFRGKKDFITACTLNQIVPSEAACEAKMQLQWFHTVVGCPSPHVRVSS
eukprot:GSMAST32.ASY1.ANO1.1326.1 assembled CDS